MPPNDADLSITAAIAGSDEVKAAIKDIALTGANAFQGLTNAIESGNFAGLAALFSPVAGAIVAAAQAAYDFAKSQAEAVVQLKAMADATGSTIQQMQGLRETLTNAGYSGEQATRAMSRAILRLANDSVIVSQQLRDQGLAEEAANERVVSSVTSVAQAKERLAEIGTEQAQKAISEADAQVDATLNLAKATQKQLDDLSGTPDADMQKLLQTQSDIQDVTKAQHAVTAQNIRSANEQANEPIETAKAQEDATRANTAALNSVAQLLDEQLKNLKDVSDAMNGLGPLKDELKNVSPGTLLRTEEYRTTQGGGNAQNPLEVIQQIARDSSKIPQQLTAVLRDLFPTRNMDEITRLAEEVRKNQATPENLAKVTGPELTNKDAESAEKFVQGVEKFRAAVDEFSQKGVSGALPYIGQFIQNSVGSGGRAGGGEIHGPGTGTSDSILTRLSTGEFVTRAAAVQKYGVDIFHALNNMELPGFAMGGLVSPIARLAGGGEVVSKGNILNLSIDGHQFNGLRADDNVAKRLTNYAISRQTAQTGKKPSWLR